jgi:hypothetical protein
MGRNLTGASEPVNAAEALVHGRRCRECNGTEVNCVPGGL